MTIPDGKDVPPYLRKLLADGVGATHPSVRYTLRLHVHRPSWYDAEAVRSVYREARRRRSRGEDVVVDHVVPLNSREVCGLHWHGNLEIVPRRENVRKSNRRWPGMFMEQADLGLTVDPQLELWR